jgi:subtilisin family serine protease
MKYIITFNKDNILEVEKFLFDNNVIIEYKTSRNILCDLSTEIFTLARNNNAIVDINPQTEINIKLNGEQLSKWSTTITNDNSVKNWGLYRNINSINPFLNNPVIEDLYTYNLTGKDVDVVIQDTGIQADHIEFNSKPDGSGNARVNTIDWYNAANISGTLGDNHYTDQNGHGTHVAGVIAGNTHGFAKQANIYSIKIFNIDSVGIIESFDLIRNWHNNKTNGNPTIVCMSWSVFGYYSNIIGGNYRGVDWQGSNKDSFKGLTGYHDGSNYVYPVRNISIEAEIEECINDGIILIGCAGDEYHKVDLEGGLDYNNYFISSSFGNCYYHRGSTPGAAPNVICVGNISNETKNNLEIKFGSSNSGPRVDIFSPGTNIISSYIDKSGVNLVDPRNNEQKLAFLTGSSIACAQITGMVACMLQIRRNWNIQDVKNWLDQNSQSNQIYDTGIDTDYTVRDSLWGANNKFSFMYPSNATHSIRKL